MATRPSIIGDLLDHRIFRYWLLSLAIAIGFIIILAGLGLFSFVALINPMSFFELNFLPNEVNGLWMQAIQFVFQFFIGAVISLVLIFVSWFSFSLVILSVLSLFNEAIIKVIRDKHYPNVELISGFTFWPMICEQAKVIAIYITILLLGAIVSIVFIIFLSWSAMPLLMIWSFFLYRAILLIDCGLSIFSPAELAIERRLTNGSYWPATAITYGMSLTPILNLFGPLIAIVWVSHIMLERKQGTLYEQEKQAIGNNVHN